MLAPVLVESAQHHLFLDVAHDLHADIGLLERIGLFEAAMILLRRPVPSPASSSFAQASTGSNGPKSRSIACPSPATSHCSSGVPPGTY